MTPRNDNPPALRNADSALDLMEFHQETSGTTFVSHDRETARILIRAFYMDSMHTKLDWVIYCNRMDRLDALSTSTETISPSTETNER